MQQSIQNDFVIASFVDMIDYPVGVPNAEGYYNAQTFGENHHLGEDWNGVGGGDTDLGDTIYSIANGFVKFAEDHELAWGKVVRINHFEKDGAVFESLYANCDEILISENEWVNIGQPIATIGTADGHYLAHLHFEIRRDTSLGIGPGYHRDVSGYLHPSKFIDSMRVALE